MAHTQIQYRKLADGIASQSIICMCVYTVYVLKHILWRCVYCIPPRLSATISMCQLLYMTDALAEAYNILAL